MIGVLWKRVWLKAKAENENTYNELLENLIELYYNKENFKWAKYMYLIHATLIAVVWASIIIPIIFIKLL